MAAEDKLSRLYNCLRPAFVSKAVRLYFSGRAIFLKLPGYSQLKARVVWSQDSTYCCEFTSKLHFAIFEDILKRYPEFQRAGLVPSAEKNV